MSIIRSIFDFLEVGAKISLHNLIAVFNNEGFFRSRNISPGFYIPQVCESILRVDPHGRCLSGQVVQFLCVNLRAESELSFAF